MTTPTVPNVNVENLNSQIDNPTGAASDLGNDLLDRAQEAQSQQTALLESTALQSRYNDALADYVQEKQGQVERLEDRIENLVEQEIANLESCQVHRPAGLFLRLGARRALEREQARMQATIQRLQNRLEHVREIKEDMGLHGPKIEELAVRKLRLKEPDLAGEWDATHTAQRHHEAVERQQKQQQARSQSLSRTRSLRIASE